MFYIQNTETPHKCLLLLLLFLLLLLLLFSFSLFSLQYTLMLLRELLPKVCVCAKRRNNYASSNLRRLVWLETHTHTHTHTTHTHHTHTHAHTHTLNTYNS